jgi:hypothetical protein
LTVRGGDSQEGDRGRLLLDANCLVFVKLDASI